MSGVAATLLPWRMLLKVITAAPLVIMCQMRCVVYHLAQPTRHLQLGHGFVTRMNVSRWLRCSISPLMTFRESWWSTLRI